MRVCTKIAAMLFVLACTASSLYAQMLPWNIAVDSSFRIEYLLGRQTLGREFLDSNYGRCRHIPAILNLADIVSDSPLIVCALNLVPASPSLREW